MAIVLHYKENKSYINATGLVTEHEKEVADKLSHELEIRISVLEKSFVNRKLITQKGIKKNALRIWYELGYLLNEIAKKYNVPGTSDEPYYWASIYDYVSPLIQKGNPPLRSRDILRNHFHLCGIIAKRNWSDVESVGNWAVWKDILDNKRILSDPRVFNWAVEVIKKSKLGHKELRPFIHATRRKLKMLDTRVLTRRELETKLLVLKNLL